MDFNAASILTLFIGLVLGGGTIYAIIILTGAGAGKKAEKIINDAKKEADKVKRNYNNIGINDVSTVTQLFKTIPYIYFISGSIDLVTEYSKQLNIQKSYTYNENDPNDQELMQYDKLYLNSLTEYYNCYINNLKQLKLDFQR